MDELEEALQVLSTRELLADECDDTEDEDSDEYSDEEEGECKSGPQNISSFQYDEIAERAEDLYSQFENMEEEE